MQTSQAEGLVGSTTIFNGQSLSVRKPQDPEPDTFHGQDGSSRQLVKKGSRSDHQLVLTLGNSAATGGSNTSNRSWGQQGSGGRGGWVNRILVRLRLRSRNKPKNVTSDNESRTPVPQKRLSGWLIRRPSLKEKKNKEKGPESIEPHATIHDEAGTLKENGVPGEEESKAIIDRVSTGLENPRPSKPLFRGIETSKFRERLSSSEDGLDTEHYGSKEQEAAKNIGHRKPQQGRGPILTGPETGHIGSGFSSPSRREQNNQPRQQESTTQSIADLYAASFQPKAPLSSKTSNETRRSDGQKNNELDLSRATVPALGKNGTSDQRVKKQRNRLKKSGRPNSLPCSPDVSYSSLDSLIASDAAKVASEAKRSYRASHQESSPGSRHSGGLVRGSELSQHVATSKHPIADAHAREWRRRTVGGFPIPERCSSRGQPSSRCQSSLRGTSVDSWRSSYNPFDLPRIPRQPLFSDLVDLLSLSKAVNNSLNNGSDLLRNGINQTESHPTEASRPSSFSSIISINDKGVGSGADGSSYMETGGGERPSSSLLGRSASGSSPGCWLAQQPSSGEDSTITDTTVAISGDSTVPAEAWWISQKQLQGRDRPSYGSDFGSGRPATPSSPMSRRREKWNVRKRRERESNS
ncbi:hypothetical protein QBC37DRAFT_448922 [Rhypophila decipiens]|uniref:Uncharacterized protein n=1 Tax=Rhypophila decipiens TaxID=261697 RepID=A0AAN7BBD3_9PEZI|nr:hypothetical protein QBC37DRAFT_448922 [Rhypophila decipiens]